MVPWDNTGKHRWFHGIILENIGGSMGEWKIMENIQHLPWGFRQQNMNVVGYHKENTVDIHGFPLDNDLQTVDVHTYVSQLQSFWGYVHIRYKFDHTHL